MVAFEAAEEEREAEREPGLGRLGRNLCARPLRAKAGDPPLSGLAEMPFWPIENFQKKGAIGDQFPMRYASMRRPVNPGKVDPIGEIGIDDGVRSVGLRRAVIGCRLLRADGLGGTCADGAIRQLAPAATSRTTVPPRSKGCSVGRYIPLVSAIP